MNLPLFLPNLAGLHRVAVTYFARFRMKLACILPVYSIGVLQFCSLPTLCPYARNSAHDGLRTQFHPFNGMVSFG